MDMNRIIKANMLKRGPIELKKVELPAEIKKKKSCDVTGSGEIDSSCVDDNKTIDQAEQIADNLLQQHKALIFTQENCDGCAEFKEDFKQQISEGKIKEVDIYSESGEIMDKKFVIDDTPTILIKENDNFEKCIHAEDGKIYCGPEEKELKID